MSLQDEIMEFAETEEEEVQDEAEGRAKAQEALKQYHAPVKEAKIPIGKTVFDKMNEYKKQNDEFRKEINEMKEQLKVARYYVDNHEMRNIMSDADKYQNDIMSKPELAQYFKAEEVFPFITQEATKTGGKARIMNPQEVLAIKYFPQVAKELYELRKKIKEDEAMYNDNFMGRDWESTTPEPYKDAKSASDIFKIAKSL